MVLCDSLPQDLREFSKPVFNSIVNQQLPDVQAGFGKGRGTRDQIANIRCIVKKQESSRKTSTSALLTTPKPLTVWITTNCYLPSEKSVCRPRSNSESWTWNNRLFPNRERSTSRVYTVTLLI